MRSALAVLNGTGTADPYARWAGVGGQPPPLCPNRVIGKVGFSTNGYLPPTSHNSINRDRAPAPFWAFVAGNRTRTRNLRRLSAPFDFRHCVKNVFSHHPAKLSVDRVCLPIAESPEGNAVTRLPSVLRRTLSNSRSGPQHPRRLCCKHGQPRLSRAPDGHAGCSKGSGSPQAPQIMARRSGGPATTGSKTSGERLCEIILPMKATIAVIQRAFLVLSAFLAPLLAQTPGSQPQQPEFIRQGQQLMREGKLDDALALYRKTLQTSPNSVPALNAAGNVLDLKGQGEEARKYFQKTIEVADTPEHKATAQRATAMSYAFEGNCKKTVEHEQEVFEYYGSVKSFFSRARLPTRRLGFASTRAIWIPRLTGIRWATTLD